MRCQWILWVWLLVPGLGLVHGQEEGSADLFTEPYTDQFQEAFFEALKQKGIENYDRAEALMLEARKYSPDKAVVDFELARILILAKEYNRAESYALAALRANPYEYWYVDTFMQSLKFQKKNIENYTAELPADLPEFRLNLSRWYVSEGRYTEAKEQLLPLKDSDATLRLKQEISRFEALGEPSAVASEPVEVQPSEDGRSVASFETRLTSFETSRDWKSLENESSEAIELYPLQPQFYYWKGLSLLRQDRTREALSALKEGESFLLEPTETSQKIYRALSETYSSLGDAEKAKMYNDKLKGGL